MDSGGWILVYENKPYTVYDEKEYFPVYLDYKQVAAFKNKDEAVKYVLWKKT